ncbi:hypothetical protein FDP41_012029 [Naegleria fowleri]|uniref:V-SNARE coiled-coil homology domain-containing protein n=1 Tax=Naegleria fowleri TaxID=5763 RepID=A0A6A5C8W7_NAEFO|nr:uncharacterized protein FDP41_012029 [Naegleria fowleri]KAF0982168.1 hypothetical protein FDP41_012029 [Naegleria fowleri]CAG4712962.1 unnamed protein product [Naegleria fowleri]
MVKVYGIFILNQTTPTSKATVFCSHTDSGTWYSFLYTDQITELTIFLAKLLAEKTNPGYRQQVEKDELTGYVQKTKDGLSCVVVTDKDYPFRVAFDLVRHTLRDFTDWRTQQTLSSRNDDPAQYTATIKDLMTKFQDPTQADKILKLKKDLEETKEILHQTLEKLMERGTHIDKLIEQTNELSEGAKEFYRKTRKNNCCSIL